MSDMCKVSRTQPQMGRMDQLRASHMTWDAWRNTQTTRSHTRTTHSYKLYSRCRYEKFVNNRQEHHSKWEEMDQLRACHTSCDTSKYSLKPLVTRRVMRQETPKLPTNTNTKRTNIKFTLSRCSCQTCIKRQQPHTKWAEWINYQLVTRRVMHA